LQYASYCATHTQLPAEAIAGREETETMKNTLKGAAKGFTLIELMIVVAIIGILAAIALPKFADLITKSKESSVKGTLGTVRSALSIYYSDNEGTNPSGDPIDAMTLGGKYLDDRPHIALPRNM
jgi:prepilin-type N-terminal cleavage/methylation domain-containing protein